MIELPVDFEERVRRPPVVGGAGYPYRISAKDLMDNFRALAEAEGSVGGDTQELLVVDNGVFKTGNFYIDGELEEVY